MEATMKMIKYVVALSVLALNPLQVAAQESFYVGSWGGFFEKLIREEIIPNFERDHKVKVEYVSGNSTDTLAKLQAQKGNQKLDIAIADDSAMHMAIQLGFCRKINDLPTTLYESARFPEDKAVGFGLLGTGIVYNKEYFAKQGWPAPTSWTDIADPKYKGKLILPPVISTYGLHTLLMMAQIQGGGPNNIEPGFDYIKTKVAPNVLSFEPTQGKFTELFQSGQAVIGIWGSAPMKSFMDTGFPVEFVYPKEGSPGQRTSVCPVAKDRDSGLADAWIKAMLALDFQGVFAKKYGYGPARKDAPVMPDEAKLAPIGERATKLISLDWAAINQHRAAWTDRWNREIER
jgi:putative spermidine/putrescine transport system substrate-binding protein